MKYWRSMWLTPSLESGKTKLFRELKAGRPDRSVWLIALSESPGHLLDIYPGKTLRQKHYKKSEQIVIAAAGTKEEALRSVDDTGDGVYVFVITSDNRESVFADKNSIFNLMLPYASVEETEALLKTLPCNGMR